MTGSQRQVGKLFPGDMLRQVFLGTLVLGDEARAMQYGHDTHCLDVHPTRSGTHDIVT